MLTDKPPWWPIWCRCPSWPSPCRWSAGEVAVGSVDRTVPVTSRSAVVPQGALLCMPPPGWGSCSQWSVSVESRSYHFNYSTSHLHRPASHTILVKVRQIHSDQNMDMKNGKNQAKSHHKQIELYENCILSQKQSSDGTRMWLSLSLQTFPSKHPYQRYPTAACWKADGA